MRCPFCHKENNIIPDETIKNYTCTYCNTSYSLDHRILSFNDFWSHMKDRKELVREFKEQMMEV